MIKVIDKISHHLGANYMPHFLSEVTNLGQMSFILSWKYSYKVTQQLRNEHLIKLTNKSSSLKAYWQYPGSEAPLWTAF